MLSLEKINTNTMKKKEVKLLKLMNQRIVVRFLYATARRCVVTCNSKPNHRAVGQLERTLHKTFSKAAAPHDNTTIPVLYGTGKNLRSRSRRFIDKNHEITITETTTAVGEIVIARTEPALGINHQTRLGDKLTCDIYRRRKIASTVAL